MIKKLMEYIVSSLADKPQLAIIKELEVEGKRIFEIRVLAHDLPKLIGKEGRVFRALRSVLCSLSFPGQIDLVVDVIKE